MFESKSAQIKKELHKKLKVEAIIQNKKFQDLLNEIIEEYLKNKNEIHKA